MRQNLRAQLSSTRVTQVTASDRSTARQVGVWRDALGPLPHGCRRALGGTAEAESYAELSQLMRLGGEEGEL